MAIKQQPVLTQEDFEAALTTLRLSVSEVSRESGLPRHVVSHFRNYGDGLKPEQAAKLRSWLESKGINFIKDESAAPQPTANLASLNPHLGVGLKIEHHFPISNHISDEVIRDALYIMEENDARLMVLLQAKLERNEGLFGNGGLTEESVAALQETFALLAGNYITFRMLRGWPALDVQPTTDKPGTVRDMILQTFMQPLVDAGLIVAPAPAAGIPETEEEAA